MSQLDIVRSHSFAALRSAPQVQAAGPGMRDRLLAFGVDVAGFVLAAPFVLGFCAVVLRDYWPVGAVAIVAAYATCCWTICGQTFGMALMGLRLVDERTGHTPGLMQVTLRTILTLPPLVGGAALINQPLMPPGSELPAMLVGLAVAAVLVGVICMAWAVLDSGRMLHDRLTGLAIVREHDLRRPAR